MTSELVEGYNNFLRELKPTFPRFLNRENNIFDKPDRGSAKCAFEHRST
jgi:hypothetical protein